MAIYFYDQAVKQKIQRWVKDPNMTITDPDETRRLFEYTADVNNDKPIQLPLVTLRRNPNIELRNTNKHSRTFDGAVIEANTMVDMAKRQILPAIEGYAADIAKTAAAKKSVDSDIPCTYEKELLKKLSVLTDQIAVKTDELDEAVMKVKALSDVEEEAYGIRDNVLSKMSELRAVADEAETMMSEKYWPFPTYGELLFGVR